MPRNPIPEDLRPRRVNKPELERRELFRKALESVVDEALGRRRWRPESWQVELAAWILAREYEWSVTGHGDIWVHAHTTASELGRAMKADGRLTEWGNWPDDDPRQPEWVRRRARERSATPAKPVMLLPNALEGDVDG